MLDQLIPAGLPVLPRAELRSSKLTQRGRSPPQQLVGSRYESPLQLERREWQRTYAQCVLWLRQLGSRSLRMTAYKSVAT